MDTGRLTSLERKKKWTKKKGHFEFFTLPMKELTIDKFLQHRSCLLTEDKLSNEVRIFMAYSFRFLKIFHKFSRIYSLSSFSPPPILSKCLQIFILMFYSTFKFNKFHQLVEDLLLLTCVTVVVKGKVT